MTEARVERVHEDRMGARDYLAQAEELFRDAEADALSSAGQAILLHSSAVAACDAILSVPA
jgi:hypothetical protein